MPNSSASISVSTSAAQLIATNGPCRRRLSSWICRATSSLPVPLSPSISTVKSVVATRSMRSRSACITEARSDQRRRAVDRARHGGVGQARQTLDLEQQRRQAGRRLEQLTAPFVDAALLSGNDASSTTRLRRIAGRDGKGDVVARPHRLADADGGRPRQLAELHRLGLNDSSQTGDEQRPEIARRRMGHAVGGHLTHEIRQSATTIGFAPGDIGGLVRQKRLRPFVPPGARCDWR